MYIHVDVCVRVFYSVSHELHGMLESVRFPGYEEEDYESKEGEGAAIEVFSESGSSEVNSCDGEHAVYIAIQTPSPCSGSNTWLNCNLCINVHVTFRDICYVEWYVHTCTCMIVYIIYMYVYCI